MMQFLKNIVLTMKSIWNKETVHWINLADAHIFQQQYNLYFRQLKYFGMHYIADEEVVCDLIQDLWLKIWERKENRINEATFKQYLFQGLYWITSSTTTW